MAQHMEAQHGHERYGKTYKESCLIKPGKKGDIL